MAKNTSPIFEKIPVLWLLALAAANAARDGSGTINVLGDGGTEGVRADRITASSAQATVAANSAMVGNIFLSTDSGVTWALFDSFAIPSVTASASAISARIQAAYTNGLILKDSTHKIGFTISVYAGVQDRMQIVLQGGDLAA
jgi:hypothetical protein